MPTFASRPFSGRLPLLFVVLLGMSRCTSQAPESPGEEFVPQWAKSAVWYQVFPERFRNGDPTNDPTIETLLGSDPQEPPVAWRVHPWGSDWFELQDYEQQNGDRQLWRHLLRRRYGGDLQGVIDKLPYLDSLGVNALYLNPVFDSPSLHKYDAKSYHHIDPNFGPDPEGDRALIAGENPLDPTDWAWTSADELALDLISLAHERGMRVIFDGVFNHMGIGSFAFQDVVANQQQSAFADWFMVNAWDDPAAGTEFDYEGWVGVASLPAFQEDEGGIVEGPREYIFAAVDRWMNPMGAGIEHGIDGWRLDVAWDVGHPFWKKFRTHVKSINPEAYLTAEIVAPPEDVQPYMMGDEFDGEMNYNFAFTAAEFLFNPGENRITASQFDAKLEELRGLYPKGVAAVSQNLFGSHDANRIGSHIRNRGIGNFRDWGSYFGLSKSENRDYDVTKPTPDDIQLQKLFAVLQMTYVGAPMIYYGDEVGMWGANDPDDRKPMLWPDIEYQDEVYNPDQSTRRPDVVAINQDLLEHYRALVQIRTAHEALQTGEYRTLVADDANRVFAFERWTDAERILVVLNAGSSPAEVRVPPDGWGNDDGARITTPSGCFRDLLTGQVLESDGDALVLSAAATSGAILAACE
ncbi:MAG: cyclomaltodextrinase [Rhodothermales bacterium]|jgi:cyclomaltodextrinase